MNDVDKQIKFEVIKESYLVKERHNTNQILKMGVVLIPLVILFKNNIYLFFSNYTVWWIKVFTQDYIFPLKLLLVVVLSGGIVFSIFFANLFLNWIVDFGWKNSLENFKRFAKDTKKLFDK